MRHPLAVSLIALALILAGLGTFNGALILLALPFLLYLAAGLLAAPDDLHLTVTRHLSHDRAVVESPIVVTLTVINRGRALADVYIADRVPNGLTVRDGDASQWTPLAAGATRTVRYTAAGGRGTYRFQTVTVTARDRLGLFALRRVYRVENDLLLYVAPDGNRLRHVTLQPQQTRVYAGTITARSGGQGVAFHGVRPYASGDSLRYINWRASARRPDGLVTNEYDQERAADVGLIVDARRASNPLRGPHSLLEHTIEATVYLADTLLNQGNRVALLIYGDSIDYTLPGYGKRQREKIMDALGRAHLGESLVFEELTYLPVRLFPAGSQIVFVTPLLENDVPFLKRLRAFGYQVMVVAPNPIEYERQALPQTEAVQFAVQLARLERAMVLRQLLQAGVFTLDWRVTERFDEAVGARLMARRRAAWQ